MQNLVLCILEIIIGVLLLINPVGFTRGILIVLGIFMIIQGAGNVIKYFRTNPQEAARENGLSTGLLLLLIGFFFALRSDWFISAFPLLTVFYGVLNLVTGAGKLQWAIDMLRMKKKYWYISLISALLTVVFAVIILANSFTTTAVLWKFTGVVLILEAVIDALTFLTNALPFNKIKKS